MATVVYAEIRGGPAAADADDLVQEVFTRAWARLHQLQDADKFRSWVTQIARRAVLDHGRHAARRPALDGDDEEVLGTIDDRIVGPEEMVELAEFVHRVRQSLDGLSPRDATVITLSVQLGLGPVEIADALGVSPGAAKVVLHRARHRLRRELALCLSTSPGVDR